MEVQGSYKEALYHMYMHIPWYIVYGSIWNIVYNIWQILLEVQGSYNQAIAVVVNHLQAPSVELARPELGHKYSYGLVITTLGLQVEAAIITNIIASSS